MTAPVDAASLLLLRDSSDGPQVYMVRRHRTNTFLANALVFVGGRRDDADSSSDLISLCSGLDEDTLAARLGIDDGDRARGLYVAAIRECFEEAGILLARGARGLPTDLERQRARLNSGNTSFARVLRDLGLQLPLDRLRHLDHWITPEFEHRRFDTYFFICRCPQDQQPNPDPKETSLGSWFSVKQVLAENRMNRARLFPPTLVILENLAEHTTVQQALDAAADAPVHPVMPRPLMSRTEPLTLLLPGDHRYDNPDSSEGSVHCVILKQEHWERVREGNIRNIK
jgi:8-oxo-dGTP pyrophosphatase MutT (NUDIX family)